MLANRRTLFDRGRRTPAVAAPLVVIDDHARLRSHDDAVLELLADPLKRTLLEVQRTLLLLHRLRRSLHVALEVLHHLYPGKLHQHHSLRLGLLQLQIRPLHCKLVGLQLQLRHESLAEHLLRVVVLVLSTPQVLLGDRHLGIQTLQLLHERALLVFGHRNLRHRQVLRGLDQRRFGIAHGNLLLVQGVLDLRIIQLYQLVTHLDVGRFHLLATLGHDPSPIGNDLQDLRTTRNQALQKHRLGTLNLTILGHLDL